MKKRKMIGLLVIAGFVLLISWGMVEPYLLEVEEETAEIDYLPLNGKDEPL
ncbi:hypothetical protein [Halobacillus amylolyticus]|uniref:Class D sortase n=1 Tax=Halobacillus amylolyticus TaxID=2932259 RepID=A0ABY4H7N4_9BACI|nr:hypothetical protein [Halobacillus amylolyticus]UOR10883.1 hypothetical protein MUO15_14880 [Halobacillus amylolyticus]